MMHEALRRDRPLSPNRRRGEGIDRPVPPPDPRLRSRRRRRRLSWVALVVTLLLAAGGWATLDIRADVALALERADAQLRTEALALASILPLSDREIALLRRSRNAVHVDYARSLGIAPPVDRTALEARPVSDSLVTLRSNDRFLVSRMRYGVPAVTPDAAVALDSIVTRFAARLNARGAPAHRLLVTSALRTTDDQRRLGQVNSNATRGRSSHEYGTTFDLTYARFRATPLPDSLPELAGLGWTRRFAEPIVRERLQDARLGFASRYTDELAAELGRVLIALEDEGILVVVRERRQPVYHVTVAQRLGNRVE